MCGRFSLPDEAAVSRILKIDRWNWHWPEPRYNVAPTTRVPVVLKPEHFDGWLDPTAPSRFFRRTARRGNCCPGLLPALHRNGSSIHRLLVCAWDADPGGGGCVAWPRSVAMVVQKGLVYRSPLTAAGIEAFTNWPSDVPPRNKVALEIRFQSQRRKEVGHEEAPHGRTNRRVIWEADADLPIKELCRRHGFSEGGFYVWRTKPDGMSVSDAKRLASRTCSDLKRSKKIEPS